MIRNFRFPVALLFLLVACQGPESLVLKKYFTAVQFKDKKTLGSIAVEPSMPNLTKWEVVSVGLETTEPAPLRSLTQAAEQAKAKLDDCKRKALEAQGTLEVAKQDLDKASRKEKAAAQADVDAKKAAYDQAYQAVKDALKTSNNAKEAMETEQKIAKLSAGDLPGIETMEGDFRAKDVTVKLTVKQEDGTEGAKDYVVSLRAYKLTNPATRRTIRGKWIILRIHPVGE